MSPLAEWVQLGPEPMLQVTMMVAATPRDLVPASGLAFNKDALS